MQVERPWCYQIRTVIADIFTYPLVHFCMLVYSLGQEEPVEEVMATQTSILAWRIPWTEESGCYNPQGDRESNMTAAT